MKKIILLSIIFLSGCISTQSPVPDSFKGEVATIDDTLTRVSGSKAAFFILHAVDDIKLTNAISNSEAVSRGSHLESRGATREIIASKPQVFHLIGQIHHSAPIGYMFNAGDNYYIEGLIDFTPLPSQHYVITGKLSAKHSAIWIEDINGNIVSSIIEKFVNDDSIKNSQITPYNGTVISERSRVEKFKHLQQGESYTLMIKKLGQPDEVEYIEGNFFTQRPGEVMLKYSQLGTVSLNHTGKAKSPQYVKTITVAIQLESELEQLESELLVLEKEALRKLAKSYAKQDSINTKVLDLIAHKIWIEKNNSDPVTIDATSWLCKVLGKSKNGRYKEHLLRITSSTHSKKLKKYANLSQENLPTSESPFLIEDYLTKINTEVNNKF